MLFRFTLGDMKLFSRFNHLCIKSLIRIISHDKAICRGPISWERHQILLQMNLFDTSDFLLRFWVQCLMVLEL